jgi:hypothetical protein
MDRPIKFWEFGIGCVVFIISILMMVYNRGSMEGKYIERMAVQDMRINDLNAQLKEMKDGSERKNQIILDRLDKMADTYNNILVVLQNKEDRK